MAIRPGRRGGRGRVGGHGVPAPAGIGAGTGEGGPIILVGGLPPPRRSYGDHTGSPVSVSSWWWG